MSSPAAEPGKPALAHPRTRAILVAILILTPLLFLGGPHSDSARSFKLAWQFGHPLFFFLCNALWLRTPWALARRSWFARFAVAMAATLLVGAAIEWLQGFAGRDSSWSDIRLDLLGAALAMTLLAPRVGRFERAASVLLTTGSLALLLWLDLRPLVLALTDERHARQEFPVLATHRSDLEMLRWTTPDRRHYMDAPERPGMHALRFGLPPAPYSGFGLKYFPRDWRGFDQLEFDVYLSPTAPRQLSCRIHDLAHETDNRYRDRFNRSFPVAPGWNALSIPLADVLHAPEGRLMDMSRIHGFGCFFVGLDHPELLVLGPVVLR